MKSIEGLWEGTGEEITLLENGVIKKICLKLFFEIKKVEGNTYIGKTKYFLIDGPLHFEENFLILRNGDEFISEDSSGSGINFYNFEQGFHLFGLNKLTYKYNLNGSSLGNLNGEYILYRSHHHY